MVKVVKKVNGAWDYAIELSRAARMFTLAQVARHPNISWRSQPRKRAWDFLQPYRNEINVTLNAPGKPSIWRLNYTTKKRLELTYRDVNPLSQKSEHWLLLGDLWITMTQYGGRPSKWISEKESISMFDVYATWQQVEFLIEVQKSKLSPTRWDEKWRRRFQWINKQFNDKPYKPYVVCVDYSGTGKPYNGVRYFNNDIAFANAVNRSIRKRADV